MTDFFNGNLFESPQGFLNSDTGWGEGGGGIGDITGRRGGLTGEENLRGNDFDDLNFFKAKNSFL